ncbi:MAG: ABC transporter permease [Oscillospiraceae bacterium]
MIFWMALFPIILGIFFKIAFSDIYENSTQFSSVPVAVVNIEKNDTLKKVLENISKDKQPLLKVQYEDKEQALKALKSNDVIAVIYADSLSASVSADGIKQTIVKSFLEQYKVNESVITETAKENPQNLQKVMAKLNAEISANKTIPLTDRKMDNTEQYFYNLIAMVAMFGSLLGIYIAIENQGNLSPLGARKCCSPQNKLVEIISNLLALFCVETMCMLISVSFVQFVLKIDFGSDLPYVYLAGILGGILGVSMGFFIGSAGRIGEHGKTSISLSVSLLCCFMSGLMIGDVKPLIEKYCPFLNRINPAALISDSFYCLNIYNDHAMYWRKVISIIIITVIFVFAGFLMTRRRKYASI